MAYREVRVIRYRTSDPSLVGGRGDSLDPCVPRQVPRPTFNHRSSYRRSDVFRIGTALSGYPEIRLTYTTCKFERIGRTEQIVFTTENGRYVMEDVVWRKHFDGPALAATLSRGGTVRAWVHPVYPRTLRGIVGGAVDIPPQWGLDYDQRNMRVGIWVDTSLALAGIYLFLWKRSQAG
jgi:hypothetical protein